jgi:hypothetical protein
LKAAASAETTTSTASTGSAGKTWLSLTVLETAVNH